MMQHSETIANITAALIALQSELTNPKKSADNPFYSSKYAPLDEIIEATRPLWTKHGLCILQEVAGDGERVHITTVFFHVSGEWIAFSPLAIRPSKQDAAAVGSAASYGRRYALMGALNVAGEDDDGQAAAADPREQKGKQGDKKGDQQANEGQLRAIRELCGKKGIPAEQFDFSTMTYKGASELIVRLQSAK